jgi:hypothetical protein
MGWVKRRPENPSSIESDFRRAPTPGPHTVRLGANATALYLRNALLHQGVKDPETLPPRIAGTAVLFERIVWT